MPPRTRASTRTSSAAPRASTRAQTSRKAEAPKATLGSSKKTAPKPKPNAKSESKPKADKQQESKPTRKRTRLLSDKSGPKTGKASKAVLLISLPVEVLIEIARYAHPLDLIMLSRANKFFRDLFMDKRSAMIWRSALENVEGLPPCPDEISEPQYAAVVFTKQCSTCGGYASREMIPVLLIRLCNNCWGEELADTSRVTDPSLLPRFGAAIPGQSNSWKYWCLYNEARDVKVKLNELDEAGDEEALREWKEGQHKLVKAREMNAEPLSTWLVERERNRVRNRADLKVVRQKEIESRLAKLGWEEKDFICNDEWRRKEWNSMVCTTKPLTDKVWGNILPRLLGYLELNRKERLQKEQSQREAARIGAIRDWFDTIRDQPPFALATPNEANYTSTRLSTSASVDNPVTLGQAIPDSQTFCEWPEYQGLVRADAPHEQFLANFERKKSEFHKSIVDWRHSVEARLIAMLPTGIGPPNFDVSPYTLTLGAGKSGRALSTLPIDLQKLLRADVIFVRSDPDGPLAGLFAYQYPHNFYGLGADIAFYTKAHEIAKALLSALGVPDASHLGMEAYGKAFRCGRCPQAATVGYQWNEIVGHYLAHARVWESASKRLRKNFIYVYTHDVGLKNPDRPLVRMSTQEDTPRDIYFWRYSKCIPCQKAGLNASEYPEAIVDHLRDVHLVEEPKVGIHYKN